MSSPLFKEAADVLLKHFGKERFADFQLELDSNVGDFWMAATELLESVSPELFDPTYSDEPPPKDTP